MKTKHPNVVHLNVIEDCTATWSLERGLLWPPEPLALWDALGVESPCPQGPLQPPSFCLWEELAGEGPATRSVLGGSLSAASF